MNYVNCSWRNEMTDDEGRRRRDRQRGGAAPEYGSLGTPCYYIGFMRPQHAPARPELDPTLICAALFAST